MTGLAQHFANISNMQNVNEEKIKVKKEKAEWENEKIMMKHKVEMLELELRESKEKEKGLKKMHESLLSNMHMGQDWDTNDKIQAEIQRHKDE
jgi:hypothetical protein